MAKCEGCTTDIQSEKVINYSAERFGKVLCMDCQRKENQKPKQSTPISKSNDTVYGLKKEHIVMLQGKPFVTHAGLLEKAHKLGLSTIKTKLLTDVSNIENAKMIVFKAIVVIAKEGEESKTFTGYGDATADNVNNMVLPHRLRMAETRAVNRALRFATNIGLCSVDELGGEDKKKEEKKEDDGEKIIIAYPSSITKITNAG